MKIVHFEIEQALEKVERAIENRTKLNQKTSPDRKVRSETELKIHLQSRALLSRYIDIELWGGVTEEIRTRVYQMLARARDSVTEDKKCREACSLYVTRLEAFIRSKGLTLTATTNTDITLAE